MSSESRRAAALVVIQHRLSGCQQMLEWYRERMAIFPDDPTYRLRLDYCLRVRSYIEGQLCEAEGQMERGA